MVQMVEIEKGMIGEGMVGRNIRSFISVVGEQTYFGFKETVSGKIIEVEEVEDFVRAIRKVINHAKNF